MTLVLVILSLGSLFVAALSASPSSAITFAGAAVTFAVLARMAHASEQHKELMEALDAGEPTRREEFEAARQEMADD